MVGDIEIIPAVGVAAHVDAAQVNAKLQQVRAIAVAIEVIANHHAQADIDSGRRGRCCEICRAIAKEPRMQKLRRHSQFDCFAFFRVVIGAQDVVEDRPGADGKNVELFHLTAPIVSPRVMCLCR